MMPISELTRRRFALLSVPVAAAQLPALAAPGPTAAEAIQQLQEKLGGEWPANGPDGLKAGDASTPVRGIATTAMATLAVLQQAAKANLNLVITHEPTFYGRQDGPSPPPAAPTPGGRGRGPIGVLPNDPIYQAKKDFIEKHGLVVFRLRDHWATRTEKDLTTGLADSLGWSRYHLASEPVDGNAAMYDIPAATLEDTVGLIRKKLNLRGGLRSVGDRRARVRRVMLHPGLMTVATMWKYFGQTDMLLTGEVREWECVHYAADINTAGEKRSLVTIGRVASEEPGMNACAKWLMSVIRGIPARGISAGDPYWRAV
ncbi:MAG TPA: hypothetical protein VNH18_26840 [Bryobacteraceae bacterium]|nr:hypothetical protein [Bryobacteraceae bacterium]